jgi:hypothetical protein
MIHAVKNYRSTSASDTTRAVGEPNQVDARRRLLDRVADTYRSEFVNLFLLEVREGQCDPMQIVRFVTATCKLKLQRAEWRGAYREQEQWRNYVTCLNDYLEEAIDLAHWAISWERLPRDEREKIRAERSARYRRAWMLSHLPTAKQVTFLRRHGYVGDITSSAHASDLISQYIAERRRSPSAIPGEGESTSPELEVN